MPEEKPSQSISISGGELANVQIGGIAGGDMNVNQSQQIGAGESDQELTSADVVKLIVQLEDIFRSASLPEAETSKASMLPMFKSYELSSAKSAGFQLHWGLPQHGLTSTPWSYIPSVGRIPRPRGL